MKIFRIGLAVALIGMLAGCSQQKGDLMAYEPLLDGEETAKYEADRQQCGELVLTRYRIGDKADRDKDGEKSEEEKEREERLSRAWDNWLRATTAVDECLQKRGHNVITGSTNEVFSYEPFFKRILQPLGGILGAVN